MSLQGYREIDGKTEKNIEVLKALLASKRQRNKDMIVFLCMVIKVMRLPWFSKFSHARKRINKWKQYALVYTVLFGAKSVQELDPALALEFSFRH